MPSRFRSGSEVAGAPVEAAAGSDSPVVGTIVSENVGLSRHVEWFGRTVRTAIWKAPVSGRALIEGVNVSGDEQADLRVHGGTDKAVYAYSSEDYAWWGSVRGDELGPGTFGENLTTASVDLGAAWVGERWAIGDAVLEVSEPRLPCFGLGIRMADSGFVDEFDAAGRFGTYRLIPRPADRLTVAELGEARHSRDGRLLERVVGNAGVSEAWRAAATRALLRL